MPLKLREQLSVKPWVAERGMVVDASGLSGSTAKVALGTFLCIASVLFGLIVAAYFIRMGYADWQAIPVPALLWINTVILIGGSVSLQWSVVCVRREQRDSLRFGLYLGGGCTIFFLVGQLLAWQQLNGLGYFIYSNPSNGFFYMLTAVHGLHLLGGVVAWLRAVIRSHNNKVDIGRIRVIVELCAIYWHFLLLVWLVLFGLLLVT